MLSAMKSDSEPNSIPTIVNGQVKQTTEINNKNHMRNRLNDIKKLLSETTVKLIHKKTNCTNDCKHKIILIGSHLKGCATRIISSLDARFTVCGFLKPGSNSQTLMGTVKDELGKFTMNDFLIVCSGANDIDRNNSKMPSKTS